MANDTILRLEAKLAELLEDSQKIQNQADAEGRDLTPEELAKIQANTAAFKTTKSDLEARKELEAQAAAMAQPRPRQIASPEPSATAAPVAGTPSFTGGTRADAKHGMFGFKSSSEWLGAVKAHAFGRTDQRLMNAVTTYGAEGIGADGGFMVPPDFSAAVSKIVMGEGSLLGRLNPIVTASNQVTVTVDETSPWGTTGIYAEWMGEAGAFNARKPSFKQVTAQLYKVGALVPLSEELMQDAPAIQSYITAKTADAIGSKVNEALINGDGLGKPLGLLKAPALITQTKSASGSTAIAAADVGNMLSRMPPSSAGGAFWLAHSTVLPKLWTLTLGQMPVYQPNWKDSPYGGLLSKEVVVSEYCQDYNTVGDFMLVSGDGYLAAVKSAGVQTAVSLHFYFDQAVQAFRAYTRVGGMPIASAATARKNGSTTLGHIIALGVRS